MLPVLCALGFRAAIARSSCCLCLCLVVLVHIYQCGEPLVESYLCLCLVVLVHICLAVSVSLSRCPCSHESVRLLKPDRAHLRYLRTGKMSTWTRNMCEHNKARTRIRTRTTRLQGRARQDTHDTSSRQLCTGFCAARTFEGDSAA